jgi:4-amino-4-deoxy-L-arabinose transferase-like glycosyltransferase
MRATTVWRLVTRVHVALLTAILAGAFALNAHQAAHPTHAYQSADERSYGRLAFDLATRHSYGDPGMRDPLHWPPYVFSLAYRVSPDPAAGRTDFIPAAYWAQAIGTLATVALTFVFAWALAGPWAGLLAAALVGFYPPLILATGEQISEPLGACFLTGAFAALAASARRRFLPGYLGAGLLFGAAVLTRADLLLVPFLIALLALGWLWRARRDVRRGLLVAGVLAAGTLLAMVPWVVYASQRAGKLVPVTRASGPPLFVGTFLPGHGNTVGMKRALVGRVRRFRPQYRTTAPFNIPASAYMDLIAARHPTLPHDEAIRREARHNLRKYALGDPPAFAWMMLGKVGRMWSRYARGGARHTSPWIRGWHIALVLACLAGLVAGLWRSRSAVLAAVLVALLYSTALHTLVVAQARYNLPLMPALIGAGVAGWGLWRRA